MTDGKSHTREEKYLSLIPLKSAFTSLPIKIVCDSVLTKSFDLHWHDHYEMEITTSGGGIQRINGTDYEIKRGEVHLLRLTDFHSIYPDETKLHLVQIRPSHLSDDMVRLINGIEGNLVTYFDDTEFPHIETLCKILKKSTNEDTPYSKRIAEQTLNTIILMFLEKCGTSLIASNDVKDERIEKILLYVQEHFREELRMETLARLVYMNKNYLCSYFKKYMGKSITEYIRDLRLEYAIKLIRTTKMRTTEICEACGYHSMSNFLREFKRKYNTTPKNMRMNSVTK